jgi:8-oxo-dGTP diphosphatase
MRIPLTVDLVILTIRDGDLCVLLVRRGIAPYRGRYALPGGFVREGEDLDAAARRELREETGISHSHTGHLEQLATFGKPARDPRERVVTVAYLALAPSLPDPAAGGDAESAHFVPLRELEGVSLAFDHATILGVGIERARAKLEYTTLATAFCGSTFTILDLRRVYEAVWGQPLDPANFNRKVTKTDGFVVPTGEMARREVGRPAQLYRKGEATLLHPALLRTSES